MLPKIQPKGDKGRFLHPSFVDRLFTGDIVYFRLHSLGGDGCDGGYMLGEGFATKQAGIVAPSSLDRQNIAHISTWVPSYFHLCIFRIVPQLRYKRRRNEALEQKQQEANMPVSVTSTNSSKSMKKEEKYNQELMSEDPLPVYYEEPVGTEIACQWPMGSVLRRFH
jgi:hypothetical protein